MCAPSFFKRLCVKQVLHSLEEQFLESGEHLAVLLELSCVLANELVVVLSEQSHHYGFFVRKLVALTLAFRALNIGLVARVQRGLEHIKQSQQVV